jgi:hypothetical protein
MRLAVPAQMSKFIKAEVSLGNAPSSAQLELQLAGMATLVRSQSQ